MADQFLNGQAFALGDQVTATKLMDLVKKAQLLTPAITDQPELTSGNIAADDQVLLYDASAVALKKANVGNILKNIVTDSITGPTAADLTITTGAGQDVVFNTNTGRVECNILLATGNVFLGKVDGSIEINNTTVGTPGLVKLKGTTSVEGTLSVTENVTAGLAPSIGNHLTNKTYVDGVNSIATNGYSKLPNGLTLQWGVTTTSTAAARTVTFPIAFTTACLNVQATATNPTAGNSTTYDYFAQVVSFTTSGAVFEMQIVGGASIPSSAIYWFAIGH